MYSHYHHIQVTFWGIFPHQIYLICAICQSRSKRYIYYVQGLAVQGRNDLYWQYSKWQNLPIIIGLPVITTCHAGQIKLQCSHITLITVFLLPKHSYKCHKFSDTRRKHLKSLIRFLTRDQHLIHCICLNILLFIFLVATHPPTCLPAYMSVYLPICVPVYLPISLPACVSASIPTYLPTRRPAHLHVCLHSHPPACMTPPSMPVCQPCLSAYLATYLPACL